MPGSNDQQPIAAETLPPPPVLDSLGASSVFLDFDGTLVEIAPQPDAIEVAAGLADTLRRLRDKLEGRLGIVSGRSLEDLTNYLDIEDIALAGSHGGEFRAAGSTVIEALATPVPERATTALRELTESRRGLRIEPKPFSVALHYRNGPEFEGEVLSLARELADGMQLVLKRGKMVAELLTPGADKGSAVRKFMDMEPFSGTMPLFLGDDVTDEDAFRAVTDLSGGGILVGPQRETHAKWRLGSVDRVHDWLRAASA
ncbi:MAG: trehalose-phosphatase [Novosphingobium sp.]|nr:trehalose-phosphatase [Novosphingobium sp.]